VRIHLSYSPLLLLLLLRSLTLGGSNDTLRTSCFKCVQNDPYNGTVSNYNW
jgi:hypothetical protein